MSTTDEKKEIIERTEEEIPEAQLLPRKTFLDYSPEQWQPLVKEIGEQIFRIASTRSGERRALSWPVFVLIGAVFVMVFILAFIGRIEGHYVTAIGGVIVGYLLSFLGEYLSPSEV